MLDLLLANATVVDGTGVPGFVAQVGVSGDRITLVHRGTESVQASRVIDCTGLVIAPGFIDLHSHSDIAVVTDKEHLAKVAQGVTFELLGQDGLSYAPSDAITQPQLRERLIGWNGDTDLTFPTVASYLDRLDQGMAINAGYLVPQGNVRMMVMGWRLEPPTSGELASMCAIVGEGLQQGALGLSAGLTYTPGMYADTAELVALCRVVASYGGIFVPHHRSYGAGALDAYREMIAVARESGVALHLSHATMNFDVNRGRADELLALLDEALGDGIDVTVDSYPYLPGSTTMAALLPSWASVGGPHALRRRLSDPGERRRLLHALDVDGSDGLHGVPADWSTIQISGVRHQANADWVGRTVVELAGNSSAGETYLDLLLADDLGSTCLMHIGDEANVRTIMRHRTHTGGSDGLLVGARPHPRAWGTFPRYLGHYVRDEGVLGLEECVQHLTSRPARRLGFTDRGVVAEGLIADLVVFDPRTIKDSATFDEPRRTPQGIPYVIVGGQLVIDEGGRTQATPGRAVRSR